MVSANPLLRETLKSRRRIDHQGEPGPRVVQIAGADPALLAEFARYNVDQGAQIIDINADHRHKHGLPREKGLQCHGRIGTTCG